MQIEGRAVQHVGIPIHWGFKGLTKPGYLANTLTPFVGDGNNVASSLMQGAAHFGMDFTIAPNPLISIADLARLRGAGFKGDRNRVPSLNGTVRHY